MRVERYGFNEQGYVTRVVLVGLCAVAVRSTKRARAAFLGCGALWTVAETILTLTAVREGIVTLRQRGYAVAIAAAAIRGFSEGAAVVVMGWWDFVSAGPVVAAAVAILAFDASLHDPEAPLLSKRDVGTPLGLLVTLSCAALYLWRLWSGTNRLPPAVVWRMAAVGWMWNAVAMLSGSRRVDPPALTMAFALYDTAFEIALLYAGLVEMVLMLPPLT